MINFQEYINAKGKLQEKPEIKNIADYPGDNVTAPKNGKPYKNTEKTKCKMNKNIADMGDKDLIIKYDTQKGKTKKPLSDIVKEHNECKKHSFIESINAAKTISNNPKYISSLISEMKKSGTLNILIEELMKGTELYKVFTEKLAESNGETYARKLAKSIKEYYIESVAPPVHKDQDEFEDEDSDDSGDEFNDDDSDSENEFEDDDSENSEDEFDNEDSDSEDDDSDDSGDEFDNEDSDSEDDDSDDSGDEFNDEDSDSEFGNNVDHPGDNGMRTMPPHKKLSTAFSKYNL